MKFKFTREWFLDEKNQVHTVQDNKLFGRTDNYNEILIGGHFLVDLIPVDDDCEIWEVENTDKKHYVSGRGKLSLKPIRKITTGKQFGFPNGYWKVPKELDNTEICWVCKSKLKKKEKNEGDICNICWKFHSTSDTSLKEMERKHNIMSDYDALKAEGKDGNN